MLAHCEFVDAEQRSETLVGKALALQATQPALVEGAELRAFDAALLDRRNFWASRLPYMDAHAMPTQLPRYPRGTAGGFVRRGGGAC